MIKPVKTPDHKGHGLRLLHLVTILNLIVVFGICTGYAQDLELLFEAKVGEPVPARFLTEGSEEKIWDSTPNRVHLDRDRNIYLPAGDKVRILNRDGIYIEDRHLDTDIDRGCMNVKKMAGVDKEGNIWYYVPYFETSQPFPGDYRNMLVSIDVGGRLAQAVKINTALSQKHTHTCELLANGLLFVRSSQNGYLIDAADGTATYTDCESFDYFGNGYKGGYKMRNGIPLHYLKSYTADDLKNKFSRTAVATSASSMDEFFADRAAEGIRYFYIRAGTNVNGYIGYEFAAKPPKGALNNPYYNFVIYDRASDQIIKHKRVDLKYPIERAPRKLFRRLDDDNSIIVGVEVPDTPWRVESDGTGMTGRKVFPGPRGLTFKIYRVR